MTDTSTIFPLSLEDLQSARSRISPFLERTPLTPYTWDGSGTNLLLKLESEQQGGSYKVRGALSAALGLPDEQAYSGLVTVSSGNMGRAVAWCARKLNIPATVGVPRKAPEVKIQALRDLGATIIPLSPEEWWTSIVQSRLRDSHGTFINPVLNRNVIAGAATIAMEIFDEVPNPDRIYVPFGGGALALGTALAASLCGVQTQVIACEPSAKAPLCQSFSQGHEETVQPKPSIVDAAGGPGLLPGLWPLFQKYISSCRAVDDSQTRAVIRSLQLQQITTSEGAGAISVAAAMEEPTTSPTVCVVSGGNIDQSLLAEIVAGDS